MGGWFNNYYSSDAYMNSFGGGTGLGIGADGLPVDISKQIAAKIGTGNSLWNINHLLLSVGGETQFYRNPSAVTGANMV
jgi:hypothetical protein